MGTINEAMEETAAEASAPKTDAWFAVLHLVRAMPREEQVRCLAATARFLGVAEDVRANFDTCGMCGQRLPHAHR